MADWQCILTFGVTVDFPDLQTPRVLANLKNYRRMRQAPGIEGAPQGYAAAVEWVLADVSANGLGTTADDRREAGLWVQQDQQVYAILSDEEIAEFDAKGGTK